MVSLLSLNKHKADMNKLYDKSAPNTLKRIHRHNQDS